MAESFFIRSLSRQAITNELFLGQASRTITAATGLANTGEPTVQQISAAAAQNVRLPLETINQGKLMMISASGAGAITLQSNAGGALVPPVTVAAGTTAVVFCNGTAWSVMSAT